MGGGGWGWGLKQHILRCYDAPDTILLLSGILSLMKLHFNSVMMVYVIPTLMPLSGLLPPSAEP